MKLKLTSLYVNAILFFIIAYLLTVISGNSVKLNEVDMSIPGTHCYSLFINLDAEQLEKYKNELLKEGNCTLYRDVMIVQDGKYYGYTLDEFKRALRLK